MEAARREQKFVFVERHKPLLQEWLGASVSADPAYPGGMVTSLYFDTPGFDLYREKRNGDYLKSKLRLRWYVDERKGDADGEIPCFLEIKRKVGSVRRKARLELSVPARCLRDRMFLDGTIERLSERAYELGGAHAVGSSLSSLMPVAVIRYDRLRFVEHASASRIALDTNIRCERMNPMLLCGQPPVHLSAGVLEVKGPGDTLPQSLRPVGRLLRKDSFSKYAACLARLVDPYGAVA